MAALMMFLHYFSCSTFDYRHRVSNAKNVIIPEEKLFNVCFSSMQTISTMCNREKLNLAVVVCFKARANFFATPPVALIIFHL